MVDGENIRYSKQIIKHDAKARLESGISDSNRPRLDNVKKAEKHERHNPCLHCNRDQEEGQSERHDFVPGDASMIRYAECIAGFLVQATAYRREHSKGHQCRPLGEIQEGKRNRKAAERAESSWCSGCKALSKAERKKWLRRESKKDSVGEMAGFLSTCVRMQKATVEYWYVV